MPASKGPNVPDSAPAAATPPSESPRQGDLAPITDALASVWGVRGRVRRLPGERDHNLAVESTDGRRYVLKIAPAAENRAALEAQAKAIQHLEVAGHASEAALPVPTLIPTTSGSRLGAVAIAGEIRYGRLLRWLEGTLLADLRPHRPAWMHALGRTLGAIDRRLSSLEPSAFERSFRWDLRQGRAFVARHQSEIRDSPQRRLVRELVARFDAQTAPRLASLPVGVIHGDANDYNVLVDQHEPSEGPFAPISGIIDFGDMSTSWLAAEPAIACAYAMMDDPAPAACALSLLDGYDSERTLSDAERQAIPGLIAMRLLTSVTSAALGLKHDPDNDYLQISVRPAWSLIERMAASGEDSLWCAIALGLAPAGPAGLSASPPQPPADPKPAIDTALPSGPPAASAACAGPDSAPATNAPDAPDVPNVPGMPDAPDIPDMANLPDTPAPPHAADTLAATDAATALRPATTPVPPLEPAPASPMTRDLLARRRSTLGRSLSVAYDRPLTILRGAGAWLYDETGRPFLDCVNNVCHVGHAHPRVVDAGRRQMAVLNTNTRYLHPLVLDYADRLTATLPSPLDTCFFVNSGSEANELALRLLRVATGQRGMVAVATGYHGSTAATIDVSSYKFNARGGLGRPVDTELIPLPDTYRGDAASDPCDAAHTLAAIDRLESAGAGLAGFIGETMPGCGGQIVPPAGWLAGVHDAVRSRDGFTIADEVQTGFGRVGSHFWSFETQSVQPDVVTMGKPIGNGHPMAAVVTTRALADAFDNGMEYFSTFGGNPVSCAIGLAVLDVIHDEGLQANAAAMGTRFREGFEALMRRFPTIGDVRGAGLFLGVELVHDRDARRPHPALAHAIVNHARESGVLLSVDGPAHNVLKIKPPLVIGAEEVDLAIDAIERAFEACGPMRRD
ncbi:MAG: aminotransferase class III-fold pyridoxal phosphate-dependent enzyme [Phycisphaerales bacterium]